MSECINVSLNNKYSEIILPTKKNKELPIGSELRIYNISSTISRNGHIVSIATFGTRISVTELVANKLNNRRSTLNK